MRFLALVFVGFLGTLVALSSDVQAQEIKLHRIASIVKEFRMELGIPEEVSVAIVEGNQRLVSVHHSNNNAKSFVIDFDVAFLVTLDDEQMHAVIAHELGHVWIFTHHPFLQTEALANEVALQLIPRKSLERVYRNVWRQQGQKGTLQDLLAKVE